MKYTFDEKHVYMNGKMLSPESLASLLNDYENDIDSANSSKKAWCVKNTKTGQLITRYLSQSMRYENELLCWSMNGGTHHQSDNYKVVRVEIRELPDEQHTT
tara:strand:+ start:1424 stop:1729 length:306 start_codon:yes stop_codon:yes gene_type:complete